MPLIVATGTASDTKSTPSRSSPGVTATVVAPADRTYQGKYTVAKLNAAPAESVARRRRQLPSAPRPFSARKHLGGAHYIWTGRERRRKRGHDVSPAADHRAVHAAIV